MNSYLIRIDELFFALLDIPQLLLMSRSSAKPCIGKQILKYLCLISKLYDYAYGIILEFKDLKIMFLKKKISHLDDLTILTEQEKTTVPSREWEIE